MEGWERLIHLFVTVFMAFLPFYLVNPALTDVTVAAVCGGKDECSLSIYLTGFQLAITGVGSALMMPMIGNLSDAYGRKNLLTIPLILQIIPIVILAWSRTTNFFYAYYAMKILTDMIVDGGVLCISFSYLADNVGEGKRVGAFAALSGVMSMANVCGTLAAGLLSLSLIFKVASVLAILAAIYMRLFLKDSDREKDDLQPLILSSEADHSSKKTDFIHQIPSPKDVFHLLKSSKIIALAASVCFFNSVGEAGAGSFLLYYLKARFQFNKDQFSLIFLIINVGATITNVILMPILGPVIGEQTILCVGIFAGFLSMLLESIAWAPWVPYLGSSLGMFFTISSSCIRSIVSKQVSSNEQGIAQGSLLAMTSISSIVSPLIYSPISAWFLSDNPPFDFPGFCMLCVGFSYVIALILSLVIKFKPFISKDTRHPALC
ncbi:tetracycline resistance protein, class G-like [Salvia hispanica]|uniref:tetracycline resistance protein, class G-like n=1 Tax=Salvia hispanica TaxID=49212 RepID=UPI0020098B93|nr:tetracycline resistance protein, class G-like [Salvia hispanica]